MPNPPISARSGDPPSAALHEMTELLTAVAGYTAAARRLLKLDHPEDSRQLAEILDKISAQADRASAIVLRLRQHLPGDVANPPERRPPR